MNEFARPNLAVDQLPPANSADKDKVLTIDENGVPVWAENSGGGGSTGGGVLVCGMNTQTGTLDKTWQELHDADFAVVTADLSGSGYIVKIPVISFMSYGGQFWIGGVMFDVDQGNTVYQQFVATSADGYPVLYQDGEG